MPIMKPKSPTRLVRKAFFAASAAESFLIPVADEHVGTDADQLPEDEHHDEVVGQDDAGHREHEERQPGEVAGLASSSFM
jgi:hypothetical protein